MATIASIFSLALTFTKILVGTMYDRFGLKIVMMLCQLAGVVGFGVMIFIQPNASGMALAVIFALLYALALPLETLAILPHHPSNDPADRQRSVWRCFL